jgi:hypothetical protein
LAICFFSASIAACSLSIYCLLLERTTTSRNKGRAVTRSVEIAIQVITPASFPNYMLLTFTPSHTLKVKPTKLLTEACHLLTTEEFIALLAAILIFS